MAKFRPGQSGNPKGRPLGGTALAEQIHALAGDNGASYVEMLHGIATSKDRKVAVMARITAIKILLDRGWGKAPQEVTVNTGTLADATPERISQMTDAELKEFVALTSRARELIGV